MRNLKLRFCNQIDSKIPDIKFLLTDPSGGKKDNNAKVFLVTADTVYATNEKFQDVTVLANIPDIVGAEFLALNDEICIATADGRVLSIEPETGTLNENSFCDVGLKSMTWSPEQEVVVFITKTQNVVVMTCTYDPICEHILQEQCDQEQQFVNVGWGRKETQFHGSEGKSAAKQTNTFERPKDIEDAFQVVETSWRYDGAYFAVSFASLQYGRMFKVFDKEGTLQYNSEKMNGLQPALSWRPSGTWIAMPHALPNKSTVALFEKNGLRHREIVLPFNFATEKIVGLKWSTDSDILAIQTEMIEQQKSSKQHLYLYTIGNYHWYLKQKLSFGPEEEIVQIQFGIDDALERTFHIMLNTGLYLKYSWFFGVDKFENDGIVAVIDGSKLLLTNFSKAIVPPPMSGSQIEIDCNINNCAVLEDRQRNELNLCLYDAENKIHLYKTPFDQPKEFALVCIFKPAECLKCRIHSYLANITLYSNDRLIATCCANYVTNFLLMTLDQRKNTYSLEATLTVDGIVNAIAFDNLSREVFIHTLNGSIRPLEIQPSRILLGKELLRLPQPATQILSRRGNAIIALCNNQSLYVDNQHIADYVTSICLKDGANCNYLAFTKHTELYLVTLPVTESRTIDDIRSIESGGKLITICASTSRTVLQMPRGNLETFYPRLLLLDRVGKMLDCCKYDLVMDLLVKQRINLNIICDHDINAFVSNIHVFVEDVHNVQWINLFLSDLRNEDITKTMYERSYVNNPRTYPPDFHIEEKVKYICENMLAYIENTKNRMRFILPIITANVKMGNLEAALEWIWKLKKQESEDSKSQSEEALKYLLYLVDVNELYNVALGTYDFGLVLFVAQKSQRDPREFLPFLNELKEHDVNYRKFKIDEHLRRYEKALVNISKCVETERFDEAIAFVVRHRLYGKALKCYANEPIYYKRICLAYADFLRAAGKLENASLLYERADDITQALRCAKHVLDWQRVLFLAHKENPENVSEVALSIVPALQEKRMFSEAYYLLKTYGNDFVEALDSLLKGNLYLQAIYEVRLYTDDSGVHKELLDVTILPNLLTYVELLQTNLSDTESTFTDYKRRLLDIRAQREKQKNDSVINGWPTDEVFDESDLLSDTTSMRSSHYTGSSRGTGKTFRSSKNRRKHERKHFSLKPGNPFEDIALIDALFGHVFKVFEQQTHIRDTCKALLELQQDNVAAQLQTSYKKLLTLIQNALNEIWIAELATGAQKMPTDANIDYKLYQNEQRYALLDPIKRHKPQIKLEDWEHAILT